MGPTLALRCEVLGFAGGSGVMAGEAGRNPGIRDGRISGPARSGCARPEPVHRPAPQRVRKPVQTRAPQATPARARRTRYARPSSTRPGGVSASARSYQSGSASQCGSFSSKADPLPPRGPGAARPLRKSFTNPNRPGLSARPQRPQQRPEQEAELAADQQRRPAPQPAARAQVMHVEPVGQLDRHHRQEHRRPQTEPNRPRPSPSSAFSRRPFMAISSRPLGRGDLSAGPRRAVLRAARRPRYLLPRWASTAGTVRSMIAMSRRRLHRLA